jgi:hypothetical protein
MIHLVASETYPYSMYPCSLSAVFEMQDLNYAIESVTNYLQWHLVMLVVETSTLGMRFMSEFDKLGDLKAAVSVYLPENYESVLNLFGRVLKSSGRKLGVSYSGEIQGKNIL